MGKTYQTFLSVEKSLASFFPTKLSSHGEEPEQQENMKKKKKV
jgi:hypothetical protein